MNLTLLSGNRLSFISKRKKAVKLIQATPSLLGQHELSPTSRTPLKMSSEADIIVA